MGFNSAFKELMQLGFQYSVYLDFLELLYTHSNGTYSDCPSTIILVDGSREPRARSSPSGMRTFQVPDNSGHV